MHGERLKQKFDHARMFNVNVIRPTHLIKFSDVEVNCSTI